MTIFKNSYKKILLALVLLISVSLGLTYAYLGNKRKLLIAPMIGGLDSCIFKKKELAHDTPNAMYTKLCLTDEASSSQLIESTLKNIADKDLLTSNYTLGYTLYVPLLKLFEIKGNNFEINQEAVKRIAKSIANTDRPVILYLFSDHFGVGSPVENLLAGDPENLLQTVKGIMPTDKYYNVNIYPWSFVNTGNPITRLRETAFNAVLDEVCKLPWYVVRRVKGVTLLGELHHMFPDFQGGMGFSGDYLISDYSKHSAAGFRRFLADKYKTLGGLNRYLGSSFSTFDDIEPPGKDIRKDKLRHYWEHMDAYAHGTLPISGWVARGKSDPAGKDWVQIFDNGALVARVPVAYGRQDVLAAHPGLNSSDVGWSYNFNYSAVAPGLHKIDILLERGSAPLTRLASRQIAIMERSQATPQLLPSSELPPFTEVGGSVLFHIDNPVELASYYYNPLATLWHEFRKSQVTNYLAHFGNIAKSKCINPERIYSHQILPFVNPGWDENKYAVGADLAVPPDIRLGISLYGEASYGTSFFDWFKGTQRTSYGVTEFHPLKKMNASELDAVLDHHFRNKAQFISFFVEGTGLDEDPTHKANLFSFDSKNKNAGSDVLFESTRDILKSR